MKSLSLARIASNAISILMLLSQLLLVHAQKTNGTHPLVPALIVFGDSIVDTGNNNKIPTIVRCDFPPYGQDFVGQQPTGRFSNGKIVSDFIASKLGVKELLPAYSNVGQQDLPTGVSFASGGTGFDNLTVKTASAISLFKQLEMFKEYKEKLKSMVGEKKAANIIADSLYILCAGSNDVVLYFSMPFGPRGHDIPSYADFLMQTASNFIQELIKLGAKKIFVAGIPPIGCVPSQRTLAGGILRDCALDRNQLAQLYNSKLSRELQRLTSRLHGMKLIYVDIYTNLLDIIQHPQNYGFENSSKGCCGTGKLEAAILCNRFSTTCKNASSYVFWDSYHPSERACKVLVDILHQKYARFLN